MGLQGAAASTMYTRGVLRWSLSYGDTTKDLTLTLTLSGGKTAGAIWGENSRQTLTTSNANPKLRYITTTVVRGGCSECYKRISVSSQRVQR
jgi:hypothetical protein